MSPQEINKRFAELTGIQVKTFGPNGYWPKYGDFQEYPDFISDPRLVLREMMRIGKLQDFLAWLNAFSLDEDNDIIDNAIPVDYILDITGLLRDRAIEWLEAKAAE